MKITRGLCVKIKYTFFFLAGACLSGCTHRQHTGQAAPVFESSKTIPLKDMNRFQKAFEDMEQDKYQQALPVFHQLAQKYRGHTHFYWPILYALTTSYQNLNQCQKGLKAGQKLLQAPASAAMKARSHLQVAKFYECLAMPSKALKTLKEGASVSHLLEEEIYLMEYPARTAFAYLQMGESQKASHLWQKIYTHLQNQKKAFRITQEADKAFAKYFYLIGKSYTQTPHLKLKPFLRAFTHHQFYLSQSILLESPPWSRKAEKELLSLYNRLFFSFKNQKNTSLYLPMIKKNLNTLKILARKNNTKVINQLYSRIRKQTNHILAGQNP